MTDYNAETDIPTNVRLLNECRDRRQSTYLEELGNWSQQLDMIFHDIDAWRAAVQDIKNRYPKPE